MRTHAHSHIRQQSESQILRNFPELQSQNIIARLTLAIRQFAIGESRSLLAKKKQDPSPIWLPLVVCILFEDIRVLGLFTGRQ